MGVMSTPEMLVGALVQVQGLLIAWAVYPLIFRRTSRRS
jgi:hypothetical protein